MKHNNKNHLSPENCNKAMCKTCIFRTDGNQAPLAPGRLDEIKCYLAKMESSHLCHSTNKTCFGGLTFTAQILFRMKIIPEQTVKSLLETAKKYLTKEE